MNSNNQNSCEDPEVLEVFRLIREIRKTYEQVADNQEKFLGAYAADQFSDSKYEKFGIRIMSAYNKGEFEIHLQDIEPMPIEDYNSQSPSRIRPIITTRISMKRIAVFGRDSQWFCCAATWDGGHFISKAYRRKR